MNQPKYIREVSDIHYEFQESAAVKRSLPKGTTWQSECWVPPPLDTDHETILILAGDLWYGARSVDVIQTFADRFYHVLCVLGNHDHWKNKLHKTADLFKDKIIECGLQDKVTLLDRESIEIAGVLFVGATLWTDMNRGNPLTISLALTMNDFRHITQKRDNIYFKFDTRKWLDLNYKDIRYIRDTLELHKDKKTVVITHHAPTPQSHHPDYKGHPYNDFYFSDYSELILSNTQIKYWFHGHTHAPFKYTCGETTVICNPHGYQGHEETGFDPVLKVDI